MIDFRGVNRDYLTDVNGRDDGVLSFEARKTEALAKIKVDIDADLYFGLPATI